MGYNRALEMAWEQVAAAKVNKNLSVKFLSDVYDIDLNNRTVMSVSCNVPAKEHIAIIVLHYLDKKLKMGSLPKPTGEWIDFNQIEGGEGYYSAFKKRTIDHILKKYGRDPDSLSQVTERLPSKKGGIGDVSMIVYPFEEVPILITMWKADEEFGAEANILFDKSISGIFCTEDIVVLTEFVTHSL